MTRSSLCAGLTASLFLAHALLFVQVPDVRGNATGTPHSGDSWVIANVSIVDGTGAPARAGSVRIINQRIADIGNFEPHKYEAVVNGHGLVLAPGFIDTHSHIDMHLADHPDALAAVSQGITTAIIGQDGWSPFPLADYFSGLEESPAAVNLASYAGHGRIRQEVMGNDYKRQATPEEIARMGNLLQDEMNSGAIGLGTGLEYDPGIYSSPEEVLVLARIAAANGGRYISHIRSEDRAFENAVDELIEIGRQTGMPVKISHMKLAMTRLWGTADQLLAKLDAARAAGINVSADVYPYAFWRSDLSVILPERNFTDRAAVEFALAEIAPADKTWMWRFDPQPEYVGKTLSEIAALRGVDTATAYMQLVAESHAYASSSAHSSLGTGEGADGIIATAMTEPDIEKIIAWPHSTFCTDGALVDRHPRGAGAFPRLLGRYVRDRRVISLPEAVRKMTSMAADHVGLDHRGRIEPGAYADLVLFDPATIIDHATPENPEKQSQGVIAVWVNGVQVFNDGKATGARPGHPITRKPFAGAGENLADR